jgi:hypothetical protein
MVRTVWSGSAASPGTPEAVAQPLSGFIIGLEDHILPDRVVAALHRWFATADARFALPLDVRERDGGGLDISILTKRGAIPAIVTDSEATIYAMHGEDCWDLLLSLDVAPEVNPGGGYVCTCCRDEGKLEVFDTLEALWADHLFEPLLEWINTELASAVGMAFFRSGGATWAKLLRANERSELAALVMPL